MQTANLLRAAPCRVQAWPTPPIGKPKSRHRYEAIDVFPARTQCLEAPSYGCPNMVNKVLIAGSWADWPARLPHLREQTQTPTVSRSAKGRKPTVASASA